MPEIKSILQSTKKKCGYDPDEEDEFDADLIDSINAAINVLTQLGVGPTSGYEIHGPEETWDDFLGDDKRITMAKTYVFDSCRLIFDATGLSSYVIKAIQDRMREYEWRLTVALESPKSILKVGDA